MSTTNYLGRYRVVSTIGKGSFGEVILGTYNSRLYAIKKISIDQTAESLLEISMYNSLSHPNIMSAYEYLLSDDNSELYIVMPKMDKSLRDKIFTESLSEGDIRIIARQVLSAVDYMHFNNVMHRDLKTENILVTNMDTRIIDFGLAKYIYPGSGQMAVSGTVTFMAPEVVSFVPYSFKADIWSVGMVILESFLKRDYFSSGMSDKEVIDGILLGHKDLMATVDSVYCTDQCKDLLRKMLAFNPSDRLSAYQCLSHPWFGMEAPEPGRMFVRRFRPVTTSELSQIKSKYPPTICPSSDLIYEHTMKLLLYSYIRDKTLLSVKDKTPLVRMLLMISGNDFEEKVTQTTKGCKPRLIGTRTPKRQEFYDLLAKFIIAVGFNIIIL